MTIPFTWGLLENQSYASGGPIFRRAAPIYQIIPEIN